MENWDEDFSTLKARPRTLSSKPLSAWKADIPLDDDIDGDVTVTKRRMTCEPLLIDSKPMQLSDDDDDDDLDFAAEFERAANSRKKSIIQNGTNVVKPQGSAYADRIDLSDSSTANSPDRASSLSSSMSASSNATSWDHNADWNDSDFEMDEVEIDSKRRLKDRQERAKLEAALEQAQLSANYGKTVKMRQSRRPLIEEDLADSNLDNLPAKVKSGTVNKNIKFVFHNQQHQQHQPQLLQPQQQQQLSQPSPSFSHPSKMLRGMRSIAQMPNQRSESPQKLRGAVSMLDLGSRSNDLDPRFKPHHAQSQMFAQTPTQPPLIQQRPSTSYKDPNLKPTKAPSTRRHKSKKPNLIHYPAQQLTKQSYNGMVLNPATGMWEGNEIEESKFDLAVETAKPKLITKQSVSTPETQSNGMLFDKRTLSWVYANEDDYDDPFAGIDDEPQLPFTGLGSVSAPQTPNRTMSHNKDTPRHLRKVTNESAMSSSSSYSNIGRTSVVRSEFSGSEVFDISPRLASEWRHADERFMRKFGKWIGGDEERTDSLMSDQQFYDMVRNA